MHRSFLLLALVLVLIPVPVLVVLAALVALALALALGQTQHCSPELAPGPWSPVRRLARDPFLALSAPPIRTPKQVARVQEAHTKLVRA